MLRIVTELSFPDLCTTILFPPNVMEDARYTPRMTTSAERFVSEHVCTGERREILLTTFLPPRSSQMRILPRPVINLSTTLQIHKRSVNVRVVWISHASHARRPAETLPPLLPIPLAFFIVVEVLFEGRVAGGVPKPHGQGAVDAGPADVQAGEIVVVGGQVRFVEWAVGPGVGCVAGVAVADVVEFVDV